MLAKYNGWIIDAEETSSGFFSEGKSVLSAKIVPDIDSIYLLLKEKGVVSTSIKNIEEHFESERIKDMYKKLFPRRYYFSDSLSRFVERKDLDVYNALLEIGSKYQYSTVQQARVFWTFLDEQNKALNKVEDYINNNLPNIRREIIAQLKQRRLIPDWVTVF